MSSLMTIIMISDINKKHNIYYNVLTDRYLVGHNGKFLRLNGSFGFDNIKDLYEKLEGAKYYQWEDLREYAVARKLFKEFNNWEEFKSFPETHPEYFI